ncbi:MAG: hypothetical protein GF387_00210 [Candidatus Portnoybacteria bacterium]|nr:hypothetical protein [Candidatus Portnoybacteria bacterium]
MTIKSKIIISSGIILVIIVLLFWGVIDPLVFEIKETSEMVDERQKRLNVLKKTDRIHLEKIEEDYREIKNNISIIEDNFLNDKSAVSFFLDLEETASRSGVVLDIEAKDISSFNLSVLGDFSGLMMFLGWLENGPYFVSIEKIKIDDFNIQEGLEDQSFVPSIRATVNIKAFVDSYEERKNIKSN